MRKKPTVPVQNASTGLTKYRQTASLLDFACLVVFDPELRSDSQRNGWSD